MAFTPMTFADSNAVLMAYRGVEPTLAALPAPVNTALAGLFTAGAPTPVLITNIKAALMLHAGANSTDASDAAFIAFQEWADKFSAAERNRSYFDELIARTPDLVLTEADAIKKAIKAHYDGIINHKEVKTTRNSGQTLEYIDGFLKRRAAGLNGSPALAGAALEENKRFQADIAALIAADKARQEHLDNVAIFTGRVASIRDAAAITEAANTAVNDAATALQAYGAGAIPTLVDFFQGLLAAHPPEHADYQSYINLLAEARIAESTTATPATRDLSVLERKVSEFKAAVEKADQDAANAADIIAKTDSHIVLAENATKALQALKTPPNNATKYAAVKSTCDALNTALDATEKIKGDFDFSTATGVDAGLGAVTAKKAELRDKRSAAVDKKAAAEAAKTAPEDNLKVAADLLQILKDHPSYSAVANVDALLTCQTAAFDTINLIAIPTDPAALTEKKNTLKTYANHLLLLLHPIDSVVIADKASVIYEITQRPSWSPLPDDKQKALLPHVYRLIAKADPIPVTAGYDAIINQAKQDEEIRQAIIASQGKTLLGEIHNLGTLNEAEAKHINKMIYNHLEAATRGTTLPLNETERTKLLDKINERIAEKAVLIEDLSAALAHIAKADPAAYQKYQASIHKQAADWFCSGTSLADAKQKGLVYADLASTASVADRTRAIVHADYQNSGNAYTSGGKHFDVLRTEEGSIVVRERSATGASLSASAFARRPEDMGEFKPVWEKSGGIHAIDKEHIGKDTGFAATLRLFDEQCVSEIDAGGARTSAALHIRHVGADLRDHMITSMTTWLKNNSEATIAALPGGITGQAFYVALKAANLTGRLTGEAKEQFGPKAKAGASSTAFAARHAAGAAPDVAAPDVAAPDVAACG